MKTLTKKAFEEIKTWIYRNARPLEFALWKYHFENGSKDDVLEQLARYQNKDGGFGNIIEPDNWNPESSPYVTSYAIEILRQIHFDDFLHDIYQGIFRYLEATPYQGEDGWFFSIPQNDLYPHAIWWTYDEEGNKQQGIGTTATLSGFILRYADSNSNLYHKAMNYTKMLFEKLKSDENLGDMGLLGFCDLYKDLIETEVGKEFDLTFLEVQTKTLLKKHFHEYVWSNHQDMATVIPNPSIYYYTDYEKEVSDALDELIDLRINGGVWPLPWEWYDDGKYVKEFAISKNWWGSIKAIEKLLFLRAFGRL